MKGSIDVNVKKGKSDYDSIQRTLLGGVGIQFSTLAGITTLVNTVPGGAESIFSRLSLYTLTFSLFMGYLSYMYPFWRIYIRQETSLKNLGTLVGFSVTTYIFGMAFAVRLIGG